MNRYAVFTLPDARPAVTFDGKVILQLSAHDDDARRLAAWLVDVMERGLGSLRLELAAPDMLAALHSQADFLERLAMFLEESGMSGNAGSCTIKAKEARAAIARAEGGAA